MNTNLIRADGRRWDELRPISITTGYQASAEGSALIEMGQTVVLCAASVDEQVPGWMRGRGSGLGTAEYDMLPGPRRPAAPATATPDAPPAAPRNPSAHRTPPCGLPPTCRSGRAHGAFGIATLCKPTAAPGPAAITGVWVALHQAFSRLVEHGSLQTLPFRCAVAAP